MHVHANTRQVAGLGQVGQLGARATHQGTRSTGARAMGHGPRAAGGAVRYTGHGSGDGRAARGTRLGHQAARKVMQKTHNLVRPGPIPDVKKPGARPGSGLGKPAA